MNSPHRSSHDRSHRRRRHDYQSKVAGKRQGAGAILLLVFLFGVLITGLILIVRGAL